jgi:serine/threonine protein kinase
MKWTDFGFTKPTNNSGSCSMSGFKGTYNWLAPEILAYLRENQKGRGSKRSDIFSTGCVFFYFLTRGTHPFGTVNLDVNLNISKDNPINIRCKSATKIILISVVRCMIIFTFFSKLQCFLKTILLKPSSLK